MKRSWMVLAVVEALPAGSGACGARDLSECAPRTRRAPPHPEIRQRALLKGPARPAAFESRAH
jgi:hypothetical protein